MRRIAVISSDKVLERTLVLALRCAAAGMAGAGGTGGVKVEVVALTAEADWAAEAAGCDSVVILGAAEFLAGRLSAAALRGRNMRRPEIYVVSWQHGEQTVLGLIESGVDQYMTFPLSLRRLCVKLLSR